MDCPDGELSILLVDDEEMVADIGKDMLEKLGYKVLVAAGGAEAINLFKKHRDQIDLEFLCIEGDLPEALRRIGVKQDVALLADLPDRRLRSRPRNQRCARAPGSTPECR